jgi:hypothetical protein
MKRLRRIAAQIGSPYIHRIVNDLITTNTNSSKNLSDVEFLIAKQIIADLPITPTSERIYDLTDQIKIGLFNDICDITEVYDHWPECLDRTKDYLKSIGILMEVK